MNRILKIRGKNIEGVRFECTPIEALIIREALEQFVENPDTHTLDKRACERMLKEMERKHG